MLLEEQALHRLGYRVWEIPKLTPLEKKRLVRGYILYHNPDHETEKEDETKSEELIRKRSQHVKRLEDNSISR